MASPGRWRSFPPPAEEIDERLSRVPDEVLEAVAEVGLERPVERHAKQEGRTQGQEHDGETPLHEDRGQCSVEEGPPVERGMVSPLGGWPTRTPSSPGTSPHAANSTA